MCHILPKSDPEACRNYCKIYYEYVPSLKYKNAQYFNVSTGHCEPQPQCPKILGVDFDPKTGQCKDKFTGTTMKPVDAENPNYPPSKLAEVHFICEHGKVITYNGVLDCECDLGYTTYADSGWGNPYRIKKCQTVVPFILYLPNYLKMYYDPAYDNFFPNSEDPNYWREALFYYLRELKYSVTTFFVPWQVQIALITIPQEPTIRAQDKIYIFCLILGSVLVAVVTCYQRCRHGKRLPQMRSLVV